MTPEALQDKLNTLKANREKICTGSQRTNGLSQWADCPP